MLRWILKRPIIHCEDYNENMPLECPVCGWKGIVEESGGLEYYSSTVADTCCPVCDKMILVVNYSPKS